MAQHNRDLVQKHSFWEIRDGREAFFLMDAWQQKGKLADLVGIDDLQTQLQHRGKEKVRDLWISHAPDQVHRTWLSKEWWQHLIPEDRMDDFLKELTSRKIPMWKARM